MLANSTPFKRISAQLILMLRRYPGVAFLLPLWIVLQYCGGLPWWEYSRPELQAGQLWRLWSAHFVHLNDTHLAMNALGLLAIVSVWGSALRGWRTLVLSLWIAPMISLALWLTEPQLAFYAGASGVLHGLFAAGIILARDIHPSWRGLAAVLLAVKLIGETQFNTGSAALIGAPVIHAAHQWGALFGALAASAYRWTMQNRRR